MDTRLQRVAWLSRQDSKKEFNCLMHYFNEESLGKCFQLIDERKAKGLDGVDKSSYGENLTTNIKSLVGRMKMMSYLPGNIKQVLIPKEGEKMLIALWESLTLKISWYKKRCSKS